MNATLGWVLAVLAVAAGYAAYGGPGVALGITVVAFWLLLQFSQAMRLMRNAARRPVGSVASVASAVMLQTKLKQGQRLAEVMKLSGSFGEKREPTTGAGGSGERECFAWTDSGGDCLVVNLRAGKVDTWQLHRAGPAAAADPAAAPDA